MRIAVSQADQRGCEMPGAHNNEKFPGSTVTWACSFHECYSCGEKKVDLMCSYLHFFCTFYCHSHFISSVIHVVIVKYSNVYFS